MSKLIIGIAAVIFISGSAFAMCGVCGTGSERNSAEKGTNIFSDIAGETSMKDGVKEISYEQFIKIRGSTEKYKLLDVLSADSYNKGHIAGASSFPVNEINKATAAKRLSNADHIVVYCGSFQCSASTEAAKKLSALGYNVLDYKGGLKEWQEKGNELVR